MTLRRISLLVLACSWSVTASAATFGLQINDGAGEGFNDPNPPPHTNQKGNNPGTALIWDGAKVTAGRGLHLGAAPQLVINAPAPSGTYEAVLGQQSTAIPGGGLSANVVDGNSVNDAGGKPADGCSQIGFGGDAFTGKIVLFDKSDEPDCTAAVQTFFTQNEGAAGVMIADTTGNSLPDVSGEIGPSIYIPYIGINKSEADRLRTNIGVANVTFQNGPIGVDLITTVDNGLSVLPGGGSTTYTIAVMNDGVEDALDAVITTTSPAALSSLDWSCVATPGASCPPDNVGDLNETVDLPRGEILTFMMSADVQTFPEVLVEFTASAIPAAGQNDINTANNSATDADPIGIFGNNFESGPPSLKARAWMGD